MKKIMIIGKLPCNSDLGQAEIIRTRLLYVGWKKKVTSYPYSLITLIKILLPESMKTAKLSVTCYHTGENYDF